MSLTNIVVLLLEILVALVFCFGIIASIRMIVLKRNQVPQYSLEEALEEVQAHQIRYRVMWFGLVVINLIMWFWLKPRVPWYGFVGFEVFINFLIILEGLGAYQDIYLTKKRIKELSPLDDQER
ncbi:MAG TPA: hypothetical protein VEU97_12605 [Ktedonobacteraceae bacterium]|nr:hypothetical protein [Ktedonobacteraceae bacterium]